MWRVISTPFRNAKYIFPTKQKAVAAMVEKCKTIPDVRKAIVFGSSTTSACNPWSDIDIYYEMEHEGVKLPIVDAGKQSWDRWSNFTTDEALLAEITRKGIVVYDRERDLARQGEIESVPSHDSFSLSDGG